MCTDNNSANVFYYLCSTVIFSVGREQGTFGASESRLACGTETKYIIFRFGRYED